METTKSSSDLAPPIPPPKPPFDAEDVLISASRARVPQTAEPPTPLSSPPSESDSDDPTIAIPENTTCRRRGCNSKFQLDSSQNDQECIYHSGHPIFHEGSKGWTCCKRRVLEFDEFMRIGGCKRKPKHLFVGSGKKVSKEEIVLDVRLAEFSI